ncbi:MAG: ribosomal protein S18-alanine N-acetyltransferase [Candidatus Margulisbacteria bacterium]|nr:ribosomal protein S18-alanine N-acetyltransferase [Candidatus Margulisiibacteriota bacterium]
MEISKTSSGNNFRWNIIQENKIVGFLDWLIAADELQIIALQIDEPYRRQGFAATALHHLLDIAHKKNMTKIFLEVRKSNIPALALYKKFGFIQQGLRKNYYSAPTEDALLLEKSI